MSDQSRSRRLRRRQEKARKHEEWVSRMREAGTCEKCGATPPTGLRICCNPDPGGDRNKDRFFMACFTCERQIVDMFPVRDDMLP